MSLPIITADQRLAERRGVKGVLVGKSGIGKTSQLWTLKPAATLFFDLEAGDLAVEILETLRRVPVHADQHIGGQGQPEFLAVEQGDLAQDVAVVLQLLDPARAG